MPITEGVCVTGATAERWYESTLMLEGLERMTEELLTCTDRQKKGVHNVFILGLAFKYIC